MNKDQQIAELQRQFARMKNDREFYYRKYGETMSDLGKEIGANTIFCRKVRIYKLISIWLGVGLLISVSAFLIFT